MRSPGQIDAFTQVVVGAGLAPARLRPPALGDRKGRTLH